MTDIVAPAPEHDLFIQAAAPEACGQQADTTIATYPLITPSLLLTSMLNIDSSRAQLVSSQDSSFTPPSQVDSPRAHYGIPTMRFRECDIDEVDCGGQDAYVPVYSKMAPQPCDDGGNLVRLLGQHHHRIFTHVFYSKDLTPSFRIPWICQYQATGHFMLPERITASMPSRRSRSLRMVIRSPSKVRACNQYMPSQLTTRYATACHYSQRLGNDQYQLHPQPNLPDTVSHAGYSLSKEQSVRFCPSSTHPYYFYPRFNSPPEATGYGSHTVPSSARHYGEYPVPTPRPRQVHDIHNLHSSCPGDAMSSTILPQDRGLSAPRIPTPQPISHPSPFMESIPNRKVVHIACYFCRKRKIACQRPPAGSRDSTCK